MKVVCFDCPKCGRDEKANAVTKRLNTKIKNELVKYNANFFICKSCGNEFEDGKTTNHNLLLVRDEYRKKNGLLTSMEISQIRKKYGLSQADFSLALGWGEVTITRYESKQIQDNTYDMVLRMVDKNPAILLKILEKNKNNFSTEKYELIRNNIKNSAKKTVDMNGPLEEATHIYEFYDECITQEEVAEFDAKKLNSIIGLILSKVKGAYRNQLIYMLWYIDYLYFKSFGRTATGLVYEKVHFEIVPKAIENILFFPAINRKEEFCKNGDVSFYYTKSDNFEKDEIEGELEKIINNVVKYFEAKSIKEITDQIRNEKPYIDTGDNEIIRFDN